jgi:class 3 adenylate cyclase
MAAPIIHEDQLDTLLTQLEQKRQWSPRVVSRLETLIRTADDYDLFRINPLKYAADKSMEEAETLDLFLHGTHIGLFQMDWSLVCVACGEIVDSMSNMSHLHSKYRCDNCSLENEAAMDDLIMVSFTISPSVREISYHQPDQLNAEDYHLHYRMSNICAKAGGISYLDAIKNFSVQMDFLEAGETKSVTFEAVPGILFINSYLSDTRGLLMITDQKADAPQKLHLKLLDGVMESSGVPLASGSFQAFGQTFSPSQYGNLATGPLTIEVENDTDHRSSHWMRMVPQQYVGFTTFIPFLTGKRLLNTQTFRTLFRSEVITTDEGIAVRDLTFLFTDLKGSTEMYETIGDPKAYYLVRQHFETLTRAVTDNSGAIVKTIGDAIMATFMDPNQALSAARRMIKDINEFNKTHHADLVLKIGLHRGQSIAVSLNDRMDFFGQSVNIAARVQGLAGAGEIYISDSVYKSPGVDGTLSGLTVTPQQAALKGVSEKVQVYQIT